MKQVTIPVVLVPALETALLFSVLNSNFVREKITSGWYRYEDVGFWGLKRKISISEPAARTTLVLFLVALFISVNKAIL